MKYLIAIVLIGMMAFTACGDKIIEPGDNVDIAPGTGDDTPPMPDVEPEMPDAAIDGSIIGDDSEIDTEGAEESLENW